MSNDAPVTPDTPTTGLILWQIHAKTVTPLRQAGFKSLLELATLAADRRWRRPEQTR